MSGGIEKASPVSVHEMHGHAPKQAPDTWVFNFEAVSTLLIAAWYVYGIFIALGILPGGGFHSWGSTWVIPFLLGIFYLGAGYLFQKHQQVHTFAEWGAYMKREVIVLLAPFLAFTLLTLLTSSVVATEPTLVRSGLVEASPGFSGESLIHALFVHPVGPVGYFIILLGFFIVARTPRTNRGMWGLLALALLAKIVAIGLTDAGLSDGLPYYLMGLLNNWIWFVLGIALRFFKLEEKMSHPAVGAASAILFLGCAAILFAFGITEAALLCALTFLGLAAGYSISAARFLHGAQNKFFGFVTRYTMAIWLMHEILTQLVFCGLFALGVYAGGTFTEPQVILCAVACLLACYPLPVLVMAALSHMWKVGFIVYPSRYLPAKL